MFSEPDSTVSFTCTLNLTVFDCLNDTSVHLDWHTPLVSHALYSGMSGTFEVLQIRRSTGNCVLSKTLEFVAKEQYNNYAFQCGVWKRGHDTEKIWSKAAVLTGKSVHYNNVFTNT